MTKILNLPEILSALPHIDVVGEVEKGFVAFSAGKVEVPPVGELLFPENHGELHIKYGAIHGDDVLVVKIATGFFNNPELGLNPFGGCFLVLSQKTGMVLAVLLEEGELTNHRTAAAGAVAAKHLAPKTVNAIGILGAGVQARLQADYLKRVTNCRELVLWSRDAARAELAVSDISAMGYRAKVASSIDALAAEANLIVTTTPAHRPLLRAEHVRAGTHVTAMGSDTPEKNEVEPALLAKADRVVADSKAQCLVRGEIHQAIKAGALLEEKIVELGAVIADPSKGRRSEHDVTIADLTGVAVQDIMIAKAVMAHLARA
jgi:ornithine cyclodeaminase